jgi:hypothetical protein
MNVSKTEGDLLAGLGPSEWDDLAGAHFYSTSRWLRHCASYPGARCTAVVVGDAGRGLAATPVVEFGSPPPANYHWSKILSARGLPVVPIEGILVGPRLAYQANVLITAGAARLLPDLVHAVRQRAGQDRSAVAMYLSTGDARALIDAGARAVPVLLEPDAWFDVPTGGWPGWLQALPSKRRIAVRREVRSFEDAGLEIRHVGLSECWQQLPEVANSMAIKYGYAARTPDFVAEFGRYVESSGQHARVALCTRSGDERLLGFCMYYPHHDTIWLRWASFNYELLTGNKEYFNLTYYSQIRVAGHIGARRIHAGKSALDAKALRGAQLRPLWMVDLSENSVLRPWSRRVRRHNRRILDALLADPRLAPAITNPGEWEVFC